MTRDGRRVGLVSPRHDPWNLCDPGGRNVLTGARARPDAVVETCDVTLQENGGGGPGVRSLTEEVTREYVRSGGVG